ncbi:hypothetical protein [Mycobacterium szulgai]|uniref:Uncharacterized protein n=1 Tax=Mycobacterium szulgai TaxID=1787 RepID=A0A1X2E7G2_MYCSZ|nr:hypothetical protein [Mycobacterium szulgai]MCV7079919.1 hypothetical protein [Mycobacterium szulgai]ORW96311.1 hypothetical protein AWC27_05310 [Mycobacterium szulgai]
MTTSPNTTCDAAISTAPVAEIGFLHRCVIIAVLTAAGLVGFGGLAATCRADAGDPASNFGSSIQTVRTLPAEQGLLD